LISGIGIFGLGRLAFGWRRFRPAGTVQDPNVVDRVFHRRKRWARREHPAGKSHYRLLVRFLLHDLQKRRTLRCFFRRSFVASHEFDAERTKLHGFANFDDDPYAEIVVVVDGQIYMLNHDGTDAEVWNPPTHAPVSIPVNSAGGAGPAFGQAGKKKVTLRQLLVHYSGLPADLRQTRRRQLTSKNALSRIYQSRLVAPPGQRFIYSDLGFVVLGKVVEKVTGQSLARFAQENIFLPLGMASTGFLPRPEVIPNIAPTERLKEGGMLRGHVHDPLASKLGGIAGNAGLFSTARDLARFCQMFLQLGSLDGVEILRPDTVALMTSPQSPDGKPNIRGFGWDIQSTYSSTKGSFFSAKSYGHTGYTGTSLWIDPETQTFLIILTNRVHPDGKGNVKELRAELADIVGRRFQPASQSPTDVTGTNQP